MRYKPGVLSVCVHKARGIDTVRCPTGEIRARVVALRAELVPAKDGG